MSGVAVETGAAPLLNRLAREQAKRRLLADLAVDATVCGLVLCQLLRDGLGDVYAEVAEAHYIDCMAWAEVAEGVGYSVPHTKRLGGVALDWVDYQTEGRY